MEEWRHVPYIGHPCHLGQFLEGSSVNITDTDINFLCKFANTTLQCFNLFFIHLPFPIPFHLLSVLLHLLSAPLLLCCTFLIICCSFPLLLLLADLIRLHVGSISHGDGGGCLFIECHKFYGMLLRCFWWVAEKKRLLPPIWVVG